MTLRLTWNNEQDALAIGEELIVKLETLLRLAGEQEQVGSGIVALSFVDDAEIRELNRHYRGIDKATDVLSFAMQEQGDDEPDINYDDLGEAEEEFAETDEADGDEDADAAPDDEDEADGGENEDVAPGDDAGELLGDIVISVERAIAQSEEYGHSAERELGFLFVHGFLHLIGYDHGTKAEERDMFGRQELILQKAGLTR